MTRPNIVAPDKLAQIVRPFVGAKLNRPRKPGCPYNSMLPQTSALDVLWTMNSVDASVISVDASGLVLNGHDGFRQVIPWAEVRSITVRGIADEETVSETVWLNAGARFPKWDAPVETYRWASGGELAA